jgi:GNAT superfamily N-acetyltransferase
MAWILTEDVDEYLAAAGGLLWSRAAESTILLGVSATVKAKGGGNPFGASGPLFGWWVEGEGAITAAVLQTPPFPTVVTAMSGEATTALADVLDGCGWDPRGVNGPAGTSRGFADAWQARTGREAGVKMRTRLFRLGTLTPPSGVPGRARVAGAADRDLLVAWLDAFHAEALDDPTRSEDIVDDRLSYGGLLLWEAGGQPVSFAAMNRRVAGQVRVGPVYTPPELRGRGYGGAVTSAVSQAAIDSGAAEVLLFTDLSNPTSNALYQRLGYRPVTDFLVLEFTPAPAHPAPA